MLNYSKISDELFKIMKGRGMAVEMFTLEGKRSIEPFESRRFFDTNSNTMINIDEDDGEIKVHLSKDVDPDESFLKSLKTFASKNMIEFTVRTYGKKLELKDFAHQGHRRKQCKYKKV